MPTLHCTVNIKKTPIIQSEMQNLFAFSNKETLTNNISSSKEHDLKQLTIASCTLGALGTSFHYSKLCRNGSIFQGPQEQSPR